MSHSNRPARIGFLLTQLGTLAATAFAAKTRELGLTPAEAGVLRIVGRQPGINQRELASKLGAVQSRVVTLIDSLEGAGLAARSRSATDRRSQELRVTDAGRSLLLRLRSVAEAQEAELADGLDDAERSQLAALLLRLSAIRGLDADVHPGYAARPTETKRRREP
ncbi:MAG: MarR family transcriptional regulator [Microbacteriaceae bacterium]|nr:MAG: MarR family transcriptional regulator [Microbacteriaceae bacterium]